MENLEKDRESGFSAVVPPITVIGLLLTFIAGAAIISLEPGAQPAATHQAVQGQDKKATPAQPSPGTGTPAEPATPAKKETAAPTAAPPQAPTPTPEPGAPVPTPPASSPGTETTAPSGGEAASSVSPMPESAAGPPPQAAKPSAVPPVSSSQAGTGASVAELQSEIKLLKAEIAELESKLPPKISLLTPAIGPIGTSVAISGRGFDAEGNKIFVRGNIVAEDIDSADGVSLTYMLLTDTGCGVGESCPIKVITSRGISNAVPFRITAGSIVPPPPPPPPPEPTATTTESSPPPPPPAPAPATTSPPTVSLKPDRWTVTAGQPFTLTATGTSSIGLAAVWWFGVNTGVADANVASLYPATPTSDAWFTTPVTNPTTLDRAFGSPLFGAAQAVKGYTFSSTVTISKPGTYTFGANSRDVLYPVAGEPHQASGGAGIASVTVTVVQAVSPPPAPTSSVNVLSPNGGETWMQQTKPTIKWSASKIVGKTVTINLLKGGAFSRTIAALAPQSTETGSFSYLWLIPTDVPAGSDYAMEIVNADDAAVRDRSDGTFTIVAMPEIVTLRGRIIDRFSRQPLSGVLDPFASWSLLTDAEGRFAVRATTSEIAAYGSKNWAPVKSCYLSLGNGFSLYRQGDPSKQYPTQLGPQPENSFWAIEDPFDLSRITEFTPVLAPDVDIGDFPIWPVASRVELYSDTPVKFWVRYPEEGRGAGNSLFKTVHTLSDVLPLEYDVRLELITEAGSSIYSPYTRLPLGYGCNPQALSYLGGQFQWEPYLITVSPRLSSFGTIGVAYSGSLSAIGGSAPYTWRILGGVLPLGLSLDPASGIISGTPTTLGIYTFTILATDSQGAHGGYGYGRIEIRNP